MTPIDPTAMLSPPNFFTSAGKTVWEEKNAADEEKIAPSTKFKTKFLRPI
jgi:hypothetical protein